MEGVRNPALDAFPNDGGFLGFPGQSPPGPKTGRSGKTGDYVEYAMTGTDERALCGIWWNPTEGNAGFYMEALCNEVLDGDWGPFRDLWLRHS